MQDDAAPMEESSAQACFGVLDASGASVAPPRSIALPPRRLSSAPLPPSSLDAALPSDRTSMKLNSASIDLSQDFARFIDHRKFRTILADPPWQFQNRTGKIAPEHKRLSRYSTMTLDGIKALPVERAADDTSHLYLWVPNALLPEGLAVMQAWGFHYKSNIVWQKIRKDGGPDGRGVGFYFRNVTEVLLFGVRGKNARTLQPGRTQVNIICTRKREHSRKPDEQYKLIQSCSPGPYLELFARGERPKWTIWGNQADESYAPTWPTYAHHSRAELAEVTAE